MKKLAARTLLAPRLRPRRRPRRRRTERGLGRHRRRGRRARRRCRCRVARSRPRSPTAVAGASGSRSSLAHPSLEARSDAGTGPRHRDRRGQTPPHLDASFAHGHFAAGLAVGVPFGGGVTVAGDWAGATEAVADAADGHPRRAVRRVPARQAAGLRGRALRRGRLQIAAQPRLHRHPGRRQARHGRPRLSASMRRRSTRPPRASASRSPIAAARASTSTATRTSPRPTPSPRRRPTSTRTRQMTLPDQLVLGASWKHDAITALGDVEYTRWRVNQHTTVHFEMPQTPDAVQVERLEGHVHRARRRRVASQRPHGARRRLLRSVAGADRAPDAGRRPTARASAHRGRLYRLARRGPRTRSRSRCGILRRATTSTDTMPATFGGTAIVVGAGVRWTPSTK